VGPGGALGPSEPSEHPCQAAAVGRRSSWGCRRSGSRGGLLHVRGARLVLLFTARRPGRTPAAPPPRPTGGSLGFGLRRRRSRDRRGLDDGAVGPRTPPAASWCGGLGPVLLPSGLLPRRRRGSPDLGADLAFGAEGAVRGVNVHPPDDDRGRRPADGWPLLGERPSRVDRVACMDRSRELPVQPLPFSDGRHWHVDRSEPDGQRHHQRRRRRAVTTCGSFDRQRREVARDAGEDGYLGFGDGAAARRPLAAKG
jgi:hypothetical protein